MARLKRASNDPEVLWEASNKNCRTISAHRNPDFDTESGSDQPSTPVTRSFDTAADDRLQYHESPPNWSTNADITAFQAPDLVEIEAEEEIPCNSDFRSASPASSAIDVVDDRQPSPLSEYRARHIARVADQRVRRRCNPPPRIQTVYTCRPCARSFSSQRQLSYHKTSGRHARALNRLHDLAARLHCQLCDLPFADRHNFALHNRSRIHFRNVRRQQEARHNQNLNFTLVI